MNRLATQFRPSPSESWSTDRRERKLLVMLALLPFLLLMRPTTATSQAAKGNESVDGELATQIFVPPPRELVRPFNRAKKAIEDQEYRRAVALLGEILTSVEQEDYLQPLDDMPHVAVSLHREAQKLLGQIPKKHRIDYELRYSVTANQMLRDAVARSDFGQMARVCRHYFYTPAGYTAAMLLGHHFLELGQPVSAAAYFSQVVAHEDAREENDPEASVLLATCWLMSSDHEKAYETLLSLKGRNRQNTIKFLGKKTELFHNPDKAISWLQNLIGSSPIGNYAPVSQWLMYRGNTQRNAQSGTGFPLTFPRWHLPTINDPDHEQLARTIFHKRLNSKDNVIPSVQPLAVKDTVIMRSLDKLIGINFTTGKRIWQFPAWQPDALLNEDEQAEEFRRAKTMQWHVEQRIWQDHLYGQFSSDGELVFVVDRPGYADQAQDRAILGRGNLVDHPLGARQANELKAVELAREGAFHWEVGGRTGGSEPKLAGCFFLGPPLPLQGELYVLCELGGEIRLVVLDAETGKLNWSQQIAAIDSALPITKDPGRRLAGATPSYSDGILICPTSASGLVAIELATRSLLWGVRYPTVNDLMLNRQNTRRIPISIGANEKQPIDATVTIADGRVIVMPIEGTQVIGYDLLSGRPLWGEDYPAIGKPREESLFIACISEKKIILVAQKNIRALDVHSGEIAWETPLEAYGEPSGRGFTTGNQYFMPTTESKIVQIDLAGGTIQRSVDTDRILGNLICYRGNVVSLGTDVVAAYRQTLPTREIVNRELGQDNPDPSVLVLQAQLQAQDGDLLEATDTAHRAYSLSTADSTLQLLIDLIIKLMKLDYSQSQSYVAKYENELMRHRRNEFLSAQFQGRISAGQLEEALRLMLAMEHWDDDSQGNAKQIFRVGYDLSIRLRLDQWLRWQFIKMFEEEIPEELANLDLTAVAKYKDPQQLVANWLKDKTAGFSPQELSSLANWFDIEVIPATSRIELARFQIKQKQYLSAERSLASLVKDADPAIGGPATALLCQLFLETGWDKQAFQIGKRLAHTFADQTVFQTNDGGELTGSECFETWFDEHPIELDWTAWEYGEVRSELKAGDGLRPMSFRLLSYPECISRDGYYPEKIQLEVDMQNSTLTVFDSIGQQIGRVSYKPPDTAQRYYSVNMINGRYALHGHLLLFSFGYDLIAVDLFKMRQGQDALLWHNTMHQQKTSHENFLRSGYSARTINNPWGESRYLLLDRDGNAIGGFISHGGKAFYQMDDLIYCIDSSNGDVIWQRSGMPKNCRLATDGRHLAALSGNKSNSARYETADLLDASTGTLKRKVDLKAFDDQTLWTTSGLNILLTEGGRNEQSLTLFDLHEEKVSWERTYQRNTIGTLRDVKTLAVCTRDGTYQLINVNSGEIEVQIDLRAHRAKTLEVIPLKDHDLVVLNQNGSRTSSSSSSKFGASMRPIANLERLVSGHVYCIDRRTESKKWPGPVRVESFVIPQNHPMDLPILTLNRLATREFPRRRPLFEFYSIDLRDGRLVNVVQIEQLPIRSFEMSASQEQQTIDFRFGDRQLTLSLHNNEVAPAAPASLTNSFTLTRDFTGKDGSSRNGLGNVDSAEQILEQQRSILDQLRKMREPKK